MAHLATQPPGVFALTEAGRKPIVRVTSGDTWKVSANLYDPTNSSVSATPDNTLVTFCVAETQFDKPLWVGEWYRGVKLDEKRADLCWLLVPNVLTKALRRGSYQFSVRVSDLLKTTYTTELKGSFLVEYAPTSDIHDIPYKSNPTSSSEETPTEDGTYQKIGSDIYCKSYVSDGIQHYVKQVISYDPAVGWGADWTGDYVLVSGKFIPVVKE